MYYATIDTDDHSIVQTGDCAEEMLEYQGGNLLSVAAPVDVTDITHYYDDGEFKTYPPKPGPYFSFDFNTGEWVDGWTLQKWQDELQARRSVASMSRLEFVIKCHAFGILDDEEAESAIEGGFPAAMQGIVNLMPVEERFEARMRWKGATVIDRLNPLIVNMAAQINLDEWTLDMVFGVVLPDPIAEWPEGQQHP